MVGRSGSVGEVAWVEQDYWPLNTTLWVTDFHGNDPRFISFFLHYLDLGRFTGGVSVPTLNRNVLHRIEVRIPPVAEQRAISNVLLTVQKAKAARQRELALERERKAALMEYLFRHGTVGETTKQSDIGVIPVSWQVSRLGDVVSVKGGKRLPKGVSFAEHRTAHPYIRVLDLVDGSVSTTGLKYLTSSVQEEISRYTISKEDVYISIAGSIGVVGTIPAALDGANLTENAAKLVIKDKFKVDKDFLSIYLAADNGQTQIQNLTARTTQPKLALNRIEQIKLPTFSIAEQRDIAATLQAATAKVIALAHEIECLNELFDALLEGLMSGRLSAVPLTQAQGNQ